MIKNGAEFLIGPIRGCFLDERANKHRRLALCWRIITGNHRVISVLVLWYKISN